MQITPALPQRASLNIHVKIATKESNDSSAAVHNLCRVHGVLPHTLVMHFTPHSTVQHHQELGGGGKHGCVRGTGSVGVTS